VRESNDRAVGVGENDALGENYSEFVFRRPEPARAFRLFPRLRLVILTEAEHLHEPGHLSHTTPRLGSGARTPQASFANARPGETLLARRSIETREALEDADEMVQVVPDEDLAVLSRE
jgi:hypothetical protein